MSLKSIQTDKAPAAIGPYSQGIAAGPFRFVSGQVGLDPTTGKLVGEDFSAQARQVLQNLQRIVEAGGGSLQQVAAVDVFLTDIGKFSEFNDIYKEIFSDHRPARAVVEVSALPIGAQVEAKCIVYSESV